MYTYITKQQSADCYFLILNMVPSSDLLKSKGKYIDCILVSKRLRILIQ